MNVYVVLLIQLMIAGGTHIVAKAVVATVDPAILTFLRSLLSTAGLLTILLVRRRTPRIERQDWPKFIWLGFLGIPVNQFFYLHGLSFSTAANGALLYATTPVFVLLLSRFMLGEQITTAKTSGILLAFFGVSVVIFERGLDFSSEFTYGNIMIIVAVAAWGLFTIHGKQMVLKYGAVQTTSIAMTIGMMLFFPFGLYATSGFSFHSLSVLHWAGIVYLGLGTSVFGYMLWYYALGRIEAGKVAVFSNGQPIFATVLALVFLDYRITGAFVVGGIMTLGGVLLTQKASRPTSLR
ncbi:MAG: DMT family transporter [Ignavibacteriales bacterium]|nr:DMT family transporter [Ignavibacteriales bacterium]